MDNDFMITTVLIVVFLLIFFVMLWKKLEPWLRIQMSDIENMRKGIVIEAVGPHKKGKAEFPHFPNIEGSILDTNNQDGYIDMTNSKNTSMSKAMIMEVISTTDIEVGEEIILVMTSMKGNNIPRVRKLRKKSRAED